MTQTKTNPAAPASTPKAAAPYGWVGSALLLTKAAPVNGTIGASWLVAIDKTIAIHATAEGGYKVVDSQLGKEEAASTLKAARVIANDWLQARPEAKGIAEAPEAPKAPESEAPQKQARGKRASKAKAAA